LVAVLFTPRGRIAQLVERRETRAHPEV
jgi:hypothetical protein